MENVDDVRKHNLFFEASLLQAQQFYPCLCGIQILLAGARHPSSLGFQGFYRVQKAFIDFEHASAPARGDAVVEDVAKKPESALKVQTVGLEFSQFVKVYLEYRTDPFRVLIAPQHPRAIRRNGQTEHLENRHVFFELEAF